MENPGAGQAAACALEMMPVSQRTTESGVCVVTNSSPDNGPSQLAHTSRRSLD